jgi:hypothetical protein
MLFSGMNFIYLKVRIKEGLRLRKGENNNKIGNLPAYDLS